MKTFIAKVRKALLSVIAIAPLAAGCGTAGTDDLIEGKSGSAADGDAVAVAIAGGASLEAAEAGSEFASEAEADMNAAMMKVISARVEEAVNEELAAMQAEGIEEDASKDLRVGLGERGISLFIEEEMVPFAGGTMTLNGELGLRLRFPSFSEVSLVAGGNLTSELDGVIRAGEVRGIPYELTLAGESDMRMDGKFTMKIKKWKVSSMSADFQSAIVDSNVTATGMIADREAVGAVDMVDVSVRLVNGDVLKDPGAFSATCTGTMATRINGNVFASCDIDGSCRGCK